MLQSIERAVGRAGALRGARTRRGWMLAVGSLCLAVLMMSTAPVHAGSHNKNTAKYWKGKNIAGRPGSLVIRPRRLRFRKPAGSLYIFAHQGEQHWVFETNNIGVIVKAAKVE